MKCVISAAVVRSWQETVRASCLSGLTPTTGSFFEPEEWIADDQGSLDWTAITSVVLIEIVDYH
ncbi:hypothetical protein GCM10020001_063510 [Nonomuraea salmonea]